MRTASFNRVVLPALLAGTVLGCASRGASPPSATPPAPSPAEVARCAAISDSVFALPDSALPPAAPARRSFLPPEPVPTEILQARDLAFSVPVYEHGRAVPQTLRVMKPASIPAAYEAQLKAAIERTEFVPATVAGCRVPGQFTLVLTFRPTLRE